MDAALAGAVPQLSNRARGEVGVTAQLEQRRRIRNSALGVGALALAFYLGFIALTVYRSAH